MRIFITGDLHGEEPVITSIPARCPQLGKGDVLLVAGDFGIPWWQPGSDRSKNDTKLLRLLSDYEFTTCFIDGNHENFDLLQTFPYEERWGGRVEKIAPHIYHLCRGELFTLGGHSIFTFGGATSVDKASRTEHVSWWSEENASSAEKAHGIAVLEHANWHVDYVITHTAPEQFFSVYQELAFNKLLLACPTQAYLTELHNRLTYKKWYFGHYHGDKNSNSLQCRLLFDDIVELGE